MHPAFVTAGVARLKRSNVSRQYMTKILCLTQTEPFGVRGSNQGKKIQHIFFTRGSPTLSLFSFEYDF